MIKAVVEIFQTHGTDGNFGKMALNHLRSSDDHRLSHFPHISIKSCSLSVVFPPQTTCRMVENMGF